MAESLEEILGSLRQISLSKTKYEDQPIVPSTKTKFKVEEETEESVNESIEDRYLSPKNVLPWDLLDEFQTVPEVDGDRKNSFYRSLMADPVLTDRTQIQSRREGIAGSVVSYEEKFDRKLATSSLLASASSSMNRQYVSGGTSFNGVIKGTPFMETGEMEKQQAERVAKATRHLHRDEHGLFDVPEGFERGLKLEREQPQAEIADELAKEGGMGDEKAGKELKGDETAENEPLESDAEDTSNDEDELFQPDGDESSSASDTEGEKLDLEISRIIPSGTIVRPKQIPDSSGTVFCGGMERKEWAHVVSLDRKIENFEELVPHPARTWPFKLDTFQQEAIYHLEQGDSVFVAAHTSAGKTVVAEYAIAMAQRNMTKAIYTSPIKALSNQKFRDFKGSFDGMEVGVITGDVQINPDANCLIMTTEILRSMLYRGADTLRDVEFVIFDEVHYVNDVDRGVVWEEVLIMLPPHIKVILLSATVPNTYEFASWVGRTRRQDIYVISTPKRPVPLEVYLWARDRPYKVIDANRKFLEKGFAEHSRALLMGKSSGGDRGGRGGRDGRGGRGGARGGRGGRGGARGGRGGVRGASRGGASGRPGRSYNGPTKNTWPTVVNYLRKNTLLPAVVFVFSKRKCEEYADSLSGINFCSAKEASEIHMFIDKAVSRLKREDRELPQIMRMRDMLKRGIGVHHGGLLPIVKEVVEILFSKSLIKVLFATETFAVGLNLPTRTVVFSSIRKHDNVSFRYLLPGEFTQMSGRAGRRGIDTKGTAIIMSYTEPFTRKVLKDTTLGTPTKLSSQFRLTYTMILNLLRIEALKVEDMIKRSFGENASQMMIPEQQTEILKLQKELEDRYKVTMDGEVYKKLEAFCRANKRYAETYQRLIRALDSSKQLFMLFRANRLVVYRDADGISMPAIVTHLFGKDGTVTCILFRKRGKEGGPDREMNFSFNPALGASFNESHFVDWSRMHKVYVGKISVSSIVFISDRTFDFRIPNIPPKLQSRFCEALKQRFLWREVDWTKPMIPQTIELVTEHEQQLKQLIGMLQNRELVQLVDRKKDYRFVCDRIEVLDRIESLKKSMSGGNLDLLPEYEQRLEVLKVLGYVNPGELTVTLKGRVACEINCGWELPITELIFDNFLGDFTAEEIVALISCFAYSGRHRENEEPDPVKLSTPRLDRGYQKISKIMQSLTEIYEQKRITMTSEEETFLECNRFGLVNTVYEWARGQSFKEIMLNANEADESEGTIVRVITSLDEICRQVKNAALIIGDSDLHAKMSDAQERIKRDIVFCASLYL